jgi:hypothetical protein
MDERLEAEYKKILTAAIIKNGSLVKQDGGSQFGWADSNTEWGVGLRGTRHTSSCGIAKTGRVEEYASWYEFMGTFYEGDNTVHGMEVHGVTCNCGLITDRVFRWSTSVSEAIREVMMGLLEEKIQLEDVLAPGD